MSGKSRSRLLESLENRMLFSSAVLAGGVLRVVGDAAAANTITVNNSADGTTIDVAITSTNRRGVAKTFTKSFPDSLTINQIRVTGGIRNDTISVGTVNAPLTIATRIDAGFGNDSVTVGDQTSRIDVGPGNDTVVAGNGNDTVRGNFGDDLITVGNGTDKVDGGPGQDTIVAGDGNDTLNGGFGSDHISAGNGANLIHGGPGDDIITAGNGNNIIWGGFGADTITAGNGDNTFGGILGDNTLMGGTGHNTFVEHTATQNTTNYDPSKDIIKLVSKKDDNSNGPTI